MPLTSLGVAGLAGLLILVGARGVRRVVARVPLVGPLLDLLVSLLLLAAGLLLALGLA